MAKLTVIAGRSSSEPRGRQTPEPPPREPLWRDVLGQRLRALRHDRGETLDDIASRAGLSPQYLSEIERGLKEPSSEMIAAVAGALELTLGDLTVDIAQTLAPARAARAERFPDGVTLALAA